MAHQVFLSFATEDAVAAFRVCTLLEEDSILCWLAVRDRPEGSDSAAAVLEAIRTSDLVLLVFSAAANASPTVLRDIERAIAYAKPVLSLHLDDTVPSPSLEYYLNLWQWLDASGGVEDKREEIVSAVRGQLAQAADSAAWRGLDAPGGVDTKREEILAAVRGQLAQTAASVTDQAANAKAATRWRPSRRTWVIAAGVALLALALGLGLGLGLTGTNHQGTWTKLDPTGTAPPPPMAPITHDPISQQVMLIAGEVPDRSSPVPISIIQTWAYDPVANVWAKLDPTRTAPPALRAPAMTYDPTTQRLIMFGGYDSATQAAPGEWVVHPTANTWAYDLAANTWIDLKPSGMVPPPRVEGAMTYDPTTRRLILFGGMDASAWLNDTWAYDPTANTWTELKPAGTLPPGRSSKMVYDPSTGRMIMFGSYGETGGLNDTWAYDPGGNTWAELDPSGTLPKERFGFAMAYDPLSQQVVVFGGSAADGTKVLNDTWAYDPVANTWKELEPSGALPHPRMSSMVYDPATGCLIMFGGGTPAAFFNDTWAFTP